MDAADGNTYVIRPNYKDKCVPHIDPREPVLRHVRHRSNTRVSVCTLLDAQAPGSLLLVQAQGISLRLQACREVLVR